MSVPDAIPEHDVYRAMPRSLRLVLTPPEAPHGAVFRARQSVSSISSCSTMAPIKSILTRHDSGVSMATTTASTRRKKRRSPSVKFVDSPTVYDICNNAPPRSHTPPPSEGRKLTRWFTKWCNRSPDPPPRPVISGPYRLSYPASLVDVHASRAPKPLPGRLKQLWHRLTSVIG